MEKEHLFRAQFNGFPGSQNNKTTVKRRKYPVSSKTEYNSISEVVEEYKSNYKTLKANTRDIVRSNPEDFDFQSMTDADSFIAVSIPIDMGDDYVAYVCTAVPEYKGSVFMIPIKHFRLKGGRLQNGLGYIAPENIGNKSLAVFTDVFLQKLYSLADMEEGYFFFWSCQTGMLSVYGNNARWLFEQGMAIGQKFDSFYYFEEFTDTIKFPEGNLTDGEIKDLEMKMWNY